jgi:hypothetical protein
MRNLWWCLVLVAVVPELSFAETPQMIDEGNVVIESTGGHLPVGPTVTHEQAIAAAYALPAVQAALTHMGSLGYVAHPIYDEAGLEPSVPATFVALSFEKPGLLPPAADVIGAPMVLVGTVRDASGQFHTSVTGGLAFFDTVRIAFWTADSLPQQYPDDLSWEVAPATGGDDDGGGFKQPSLSASSQYIGPYTFTGGGTDSPEDQKFRSFMACASMGAATAALNTIWQGPPFPQRIVIQGAIRAGLAVVACGVGVYGGGTP